MAFIDLLRHGEVEGGECYRGSQDDALTSDGKRQMQRAVGDDCPWEHIVCSPLIRCAEFAQEQANKYSIPLVLDERLREIHFGGWEGYTANQLQSQYPDAIQRYWEDPLSHTPPNGENIQQFRSRVIAAWQDILEQYSGKQVLVITHAGPVRVIISNVLDLPLTSLFRFEVPSACLTRIRLLPGVSGVFTPSLVFHAGSR